MNDDILQKQESEFDESIAFIFSSLMKRVHTSNIGIVTQFNESTNTVDVQPCLMRKMTGSNTKMLPVIKNCPVYFYGAGGFAITFKPEPGDVCDLHFNERSLDVWKQTGGIVDPSMPRSHNLTDAKAYFGINAYTNAYQGLRDGMDIRTRDGLTSVLVKDSSIELRVGGSLVATFGSGGIQLAVPIDGPSGTFGGIKVESHKHGQVQPGGGQSGVPI